jgi:hypothetical protein
MPWQPGESHAGQLTFPTAEVTVPLGPNCRIRLGSPAFDAVRTVAMCHRDGQDRRNVPIAPVPARHRSDGRDSRAFPGTARPAPREGIQSHPEPVTHREHTSFWNAHITVSLPHPPGSWAGSGWRPGLPGRCPLAGTGCSRSAWPRARRPGVAAGPAGRRIPPAAGGARADPHRCDVPAGRQGPPRSAERGQAETRCPYPHISMATVIRRLVRSRKYRNFTVLPPDRLVLACGPHRAGPKARGRGEARPCQARPSSA